MKRHYRRWFFLAGAVIILATIVGFEWNSEGGRKVVLRSGVVHEGWYFAGGEDVSIEGTINGDAYIVGGIVEISGTINGDLIVAGGQVLIDGKVAEDVRGAGGVITINGQVDGNCTLAGGSIIVTHKGQVGDNILAAGGNIKMNGTLKRELMVGGTLLDIGGNVGGSVKFAGEKITIDEGTTIQKDLHIIVSDSASAHIAPGAVKGKTCIKLEHKPKGVGQMYSLGFSIFSALTLIVVAGCIILLCPSVLQKAGDAIATVPGKSLLWGLLLLIATPILIVLLLVTIIGIPLALMLLTLYGWMIYLSQLSLPLLVGRWIYGAAPASGWRQFWMIATGVVIVQLLVAIPYIGFLFVLANMLFGLGIVWIMVQGHYRKTAVAA